MPEALNAPAGWRKLPRCRSFTNGSRLDGRVGYGGIGQRDLDVFGGQIAFTFPF